MRRSVLRRACGQCGAEFIAGDARQRYCSEACRVAHNTPRSTPATRVCSICSAEFTATVYNKVYCSTACFQEAARRRGASPERRLGVEIVCIRCGAKFNRTAAMQKFCSYECYHRTNREARDRRRKEACDARRSGVMVTLARPSEQPIAGPCGRCRAYRWCKSAHHRTRLPCDADYVQRDPVDPAPVSFLATKSRR